MARTIFILLLASACSEASSPTDLASAADLGAVSCADPSPPAGSACPVSVSGSVVGESAQPVASLLLSLCAKLCFYGNTDDAGAFTITAQTHIIVDDFAIEVHGRPDHATYYAPLPASSGTSFSYASALPLVALPATGPVIAKDGPAQTISAGEVTLAIPAATQVKFSIEDSGAHGHELRVKKIAQPQGLPFVDATLAPAALYALSPFEASFSQPVALTLVNSAGLPAGSAVEILAQTGLVNDEPPAGRFRRAATAHVSSDGATIVTDAGQGLRELTWIAVRPL